MASHRDVSFGVPVSPGTYFFLTVLKMSCHRNVPSKEYDHSVDGSSIDNLHSLLQEGWYRMNLLHAAGLKHAKALKTHHAKDLSAMYALGRSISTMSPASGSIMPLIKVSPSCH